jgi:hypothetical protein
MEWWNSYRVVLPMSGMSVPNQIIITVPSSELFLTVIVLVVLVLNAIVQRAVPVAHVYRPDLGLECGAQRGGLGGWNMDVVCERARGVRL